MDTKTKTFDISLPKPFTKALILQANECHYYLEEDQILPSALKNCDDAFHLGKIPDDKQ